jgi:hypothetical protein
LRTSYLAKIKDGVGERLITVNPSVLNTPGLRATGWQSNPAEIKRTYSPPIPTAVTSEYFQAPPRSAGFPPHGFGGDDDEEGGLITGGGSGDTVGPAAITRRRRPRKDSHEDEDSSDLSDESDEDGDAGQRAAQQIKFAKMPVRTRSGSSPIRQSGDFLKDGPSFLLTSPSRPPGESRLRSGSLGAVKEFKSSMRRGTVNSSDLSSDNDFEPNAVSRRAQVTKTVRMAPTPIQENHPETSRESLEDEDSGEASDGTSLSSEFEETIGSVPFLDNSNASHLGQHIRQAEFPPRTFKPQPNTFEQLPPPRPISTIQPVSALTMAIKAKQSDSATPYDSFASLSGKGDPSRIKLMIYAPFSDKVSSAFEVLIRRMTQSESSGDQSDSAAMGKSGQREVTVADAIGLSLWRYAEEKRSPPLAGNKMNYNRWTLRMVEEDGEVDFDFPALERTKPMAAFCSNNQQSGNRRLGSRSKNYDEFALVEATEEQFRENERITPLAKPRAFIGEDIPEEVIPPVPKIPTQENFPLREGSLMAFGGPLRRETIPADVPATVQHSNKQTGVQRILRIHLSSLEALAQTVSLNVTTDAYLAEVLEEVCRKLQLDRAHHVLKLHDQNTVIPLDQTVASLGPLCDLDLQRRRFGDGPSESTGSPIYGSPSAYFSGSANRSRFGLRERAPSRLQTINPAPDLILGTNYLKFTVWRKQPMSFIGRHERTLAIDGEYVHIMPSEAGKTIFESSIKTTSIHTSTIIGCKFSKKTPNHFKVFSLLWYMPLNANKLLVIDHEGPRKETL